MSDRIRKADGLMASAWESRTSDIATHMRAEAQMEATLAVAEATAALAEQQRIANLIALGSYRISRSDLPHFRHLVVSPSGIDDVRPSIEIAVALGITRDE
jgi:hypothetical protein